MSDSLQSLVNRAIFFSTEMQTRFGLRIADAEWEVDFSENPRLAFTGEHPLTLTAHLIGTEADSPRTWHWGWDNVNEFPEPVVARSHEVRRLGAARGIGELTTDEFDSDDELPLRLVLAAKELTGIWAHYPAAAGGGTVVWMLVESPELALDAPAIKSLVRSMAQGLTETTVTDHVEALQAYAEHRGFPLVMCPDGTLRVLAADGWADVTVDEQRRITNCQVHSPLEGQAAEEFAAARSAAPGEPGAPTEETVPSPAEAPAETSAPVESPVEESAEAPAAPEPVEPAPAPTAPEPVEPAPDVQQPAEDTAPAPESPAAETAPAPEPSTAAEAPAPEPQPEPRPAPVEPSAPEPAPEPADSAPRPAPEPTADRPADTPAEDAEPRKKGFFRKLFGR
ncbi:DUF6882 domain-containing protein [Brevibacterium sp. CS2]|uniref:DUF6882 domain-containing protein n=1 Tax=Brevibacterium sp. CS2 TaxID=2575923 RepID=UPI0010C792A5|nr:DUF6882 domain-containing protein [Brevibacterium sp. CS2]QCP04818.1 hypothetical protein FDF13_05495 [Brevibacterium sp. CS2]